MRAAVTVDRHKWEGHAQARSGVALREALDERGRERRAEGASHREITRPFSAIAPWLSSRRSRVALAKRRTRLRVQLISARGVFDAAEHRAGRVAARPEVVSRRVWARLPPLQPHPPGGGRS